MTSMLNSDVLGSSLGSFPEHPASSSPIARRRCPTRHVQVSAIVGIGDEGVGVRSTARLHCGHLPGLRADR